MAIFFKLKINDTHIQGLSPNRVILMIRVSGSPLKTVMSAAFCGSGGKATMVIVFWRILMYLYFVAFDWNYTYIDDFVKRSLTGFSHSTLNSSL